MILVNGATGQLGQGIIRELLKSISAKEIRAYVRNEEKAAFLKDLGVELAVGDYNNKAAIAQAMQGVDTLMLISGGDPNRLEQHKNFVDAAKEAGVKRVLYTSVSMKSVENAALKGMMSDHFETEKHIMAANFESAASLRNTLYLDVLKDFFLGPQPQGVYLPIKSGAVPFVLRSELAQVAAKLLLADKLEKKYYELHHPEALSFAEIAKQLDVPFVSLTEADYLAQLNKMGLPEPVQQMLLGFCQDMEAGQFIVDTPSDLTAILGKAPSSHAEGLKELFA